MAVAALLVCAWLASTAAAHPLSQGGLDVTIQPDRITVVARVTTEEVRVTNAATGDDPLPGPWAASGSAAFERHAAYLAGHLVVRADGVRLRAIVQQVIPPADDAARANADRLARYEFVYPLPSRSAPPRVIELSSEVLSDGRFAPGTAWESTYVVSIGQAGHTAVEGPLLTRSQPVSFVCDWTAPAAGAQSSATIGTGRLFGEYFHHGVLHILTGYDHLLFITALVLAAVTLWDLVKVVTAFTLAHTLTLTLAALNLVHVSERISEPLISASIVFVALQNVFCPSRSRGWPRLAAAFFFGLFHGLGFAGGLLDAMQGMHGRTVLLAILAFSVGVEAGHQMIVLPLFAALKVARRTRPDAVSRAKLSMRVQRIGSAAISLAGLFYLVVALRLSFAH